ncbi:MAG: DUF5683 domain-containing protein [Candidatus Cloacimonadaceae bacterium]|nr:DUF5683 domain-containing protein [Candidatus Cloacimonadaceae bacterium]MDP3114132.1 DUF5683 domain-containing protein [Candidatus Cloacimonadaceae bacterium]
MITLKLPLMTLTLLLLWLGLSAQTGFDITLFSDSTKYGWNNYLERRDYRDHLVERQKLLQLYEMEANSPRGTIIKSAIIPGWGQFTNKNNIKGSIILGTELFLIGTSLFFFDRSVYYHRKYEEATQVEDIETYYNAAVGPRQYSVIFLGVAVLVWGYNIFDVIQSTDDYNASVWRRIIDQYAKSPVQIKPEGIEMRF